jgi:long-chain acyl-CoA synthetase
MSGFTHLDEFISSQPITNPEERTAGQVMNYTSGTTGKPKGVKRALIPGDPDDVLSMFAMILSFFEIQPQENNVHIVGSPLYHTAVLVHSSAALHYGHSVVLMEKFDAEQMLYLIDKYKVTTSHMVPTQFHRLLQLPDEIRAKYDCSSTRAMIHAAAPCPIHTKQAMIEWWGNSIWEYYAATEGGGTVVDANSWSQFPGTVGKAWPGAEIKIINDDGTEALPDNQGTVFMKLGEATKFEYKGDQAKTKKERLVFDDQVYFTVGDIGYLNEEGYLFLCDRKIDMIISGGANIYPAEIESAFLMHPAVADVAVFGIPNEEWGEEVKAVIELNKNYHSSDELLAELMKFAQENLAKMKLPRSIDFIEKLPRDENGKLYKRRLRDPYWENHSANV